MPAYSGYIERAKDAAVITELDAIQTAAQAANATAGAITEINLDTNGTSLTVKVASTEKIAEKFAADFDMFYGTSTPAVAGGSSSITLTIEKVDLTGSSYAKGANWYAVAGTGNTAGWNAGK